MHATAEDVYNQLKDAPETLVYEVSDFTEFLIKKYKSKTDKNKSSLTLDSFKGLLENSPSFKEDPLEIQQKMRNEWS